MQLQCLLQWRSVALHSTSLHLVHKVHISYSTHMVHDTHIPHDLHMTYSMDLLCRRTHDAQHAPDSSPAHQPQHAMAHMHAHDPQHNILKLQQTVAY